MAAPREVITIDDNEGDVQMRDPVGPSTSQPARNNPVPVADDNEDEDNDDDLPPPPARNNPVPVAEDDDNDLPPRGLIRAGPRVAPRPARAPARRVPRAVARAGRLLLPPRIPDPVRPIDGPRPRPPPPPRPQLDPNSERSHERPLGDDDLPPPTHVGRRNGPPLNNGPGRVSDSAQQPIQLDEDDLEMGAGAGRGRGRGMGMEMGRGRGSGTGQQGNRGSESNNFSAYSNSHLRNETKHDFMIPNANGFAQRQCNFERAKAANNQHEPINLESPDVIAGEGSEILRIEDVYEQEIEAQKRSSKKSTIKYELRNPAIVAPWERLLNFDKGGGIILRANKTIELTDQTFLRIKDILRNLETQEVRLRGHRLQRVRDLNGLLERKLNELVFLFEIDQDDTRIPTEQSIVEIPLSEFSKIRNLRLTNQKYPAARNVNINDFRDQEHANSEGGLTVRWKYTCVFASAVDRHHNVYKERMIERLSAGDCTSGFEVEDAVRRSEWRGETVLGGAYRPSLFLGKEVVILDDDDIEIVTKGKEKRGYGTVSQDILEASEPASKRMREHGSDGVETTREGVSNIKLQSFSNDSPLNIEDLSESANSSKQMKHVALDLPQLSQPISTGFVPNISIKDYSAPPARIAGQTYTYGDAFCGGGGSSRGATMAGLHLKWGFDFNKHACLSWRANFPASKCHQMAAHEFVDQAKRAEETGQRDSMKVDILHLSPPCQFFSPAHTVNGKDDETNIASLFAVQMVIEVARPRVVTLEQTFGIACVRFRHYFNSLIHMFTAHSFSVRWAIVPLAQWGLPQRRMRLIVIASCPGEPLPKMPLPTHSTSESGPGFSLLPYVSVDSTLKGVSSLAADHDIESVMWTPERYMQPYDGSKILPRAMTTSGGQNYHPSGTRELTLREYACLQGFPTGHVFKGNYVKKQIGNAVPPVVAKVLFSSIKADLEKVDGVEGPELIE